MKKIFGSIVAFGFPVFAFAEVITDAESLITLFYKYSNIAISVLISFAVVFIVYAIVKYAVMGADDEEKRKTAKTQIIWGVIGLAIILSLWGLVRFVTRTFDTGSNTAPTSEFPRVQRTQF